MHKTGLPRKLAFARNDKDELIRLDCHANWRLRAMTRIFKFLEY